jgi:serine/threonine protein kinase
MAAPPVAQEENKALESEVFKAKYRRIKSVGKGSFGEAVLVRSRADNKRYICKTIETASMNPKEKRDLSGEIRILAAVNHPNIIRYHEHFEDGTVMYIVMEYADGGDLNQRIKERKKKEPVELFDPKLCMFWFLQIAMALKFLHDKRILHRDLKTANVFLTSKNVVKLGDFGISTVLQNTMACAKTVCGTPYYFSPEICQSKPYNNKSDVWALGVCFYEMLTLNRPFNAKSLKELLKKILVGQYEPIPNSVPAELRGLCQSLLQISPSQRPSINRLLEQPFVQASLRNFSEELEAQTAKERAEYEERKKRQPEAGAPGAPAETTSTPPPAAPPRRRRRRARRRRWRRCATWAAGSCPRCSSSPTPRSRRRSPRRRIALAPRRVPAPAARRSTTRSPTWKRTTTTSSRRSRCRARRAPWSARRWATTRSSATTARSSRIPRRSLFPSPTAIPSRLPTCVSTWRRRSAPRISPR